MTYEKIGSRAAAKSDEIKHDGTTSALADIASLAGQRSDVSANMRRSRRRTMAEHAYLGNPEEANRLHAARRAAGFKSARQAALHLGWSAATYIAHETANRHLPDDKARIYAKGFGVSESWLLRGQGDGPDLDPVRAARFDMREQMKKERMKSDPSASANRRLRLARRLAGHSSTTDAAAATGLKRTTLSAHETGQNELGGTMARLYGEAFGVSHRWLTTGEMPSGYPPETERLLAKLIDTYRLPDKAARAELADLVRKRNPVRVTAPVRPVRSRPEPKTDTLAEYRGKDVWQAIEKGSLADALPDHVWSFPKGYVAEVLGALVSAAIVVGIDERTPVSRQGDRLIVDMSARVPVAGHSYVIVDRSGSFGLTTLTRSPADDFPGGRWRIVGQVCGRIGGFGPSDPPA